MNNKGMTLVEVMVGVFLTALVMSIATAMMISSSRNFERQSAQIDIQNESQVVTNYLSEAFMEATAYEEVSDGTIVAIRLYDDEKSENSRLVIYDAANTSLYVASFSAASAGPTSLPDVSAVAGYMVEEYRISDHIRDFAVTIEKSEIDPPETPDPADPDPASGQYYIRNPFNAYITYTLFKEKATREFELYATCRNRLEYLRINGVKYNTSMREK